MTFLTHIWLATSMLTSRKKSSDARAVLSRPVERALHRLGQDISAARRMRRLSQEDLAQRIGTSLSTVRRMEDGYPGTARSDKRRVGKEWVSTCRSRWSR